MLSEFATRESEVLDAIKADDLLKLQELSVLPKGFGKARVQAWSFLLGINMPVVSNLGDLLRPDHGPEDSWPSKHGNSSTQLQASLSNESTSDLSKEDIEFNPHPDERQVQLDTDRSFVLYPVVNRSTNGRKLMQEELYDIILGVLRKRPRLRYFQGYHDIITVLFLTLPAGIVLPCAEKLSLHRLRDSMGSGLEPLVGQLRVLKRLLRLVDPSYAELLERNSPLPYYALSNLLTLFAHDIPTLPLIQHVFDWLLCHEPVIVIYLAAAVILSKKEEIFALEQEGDEAMGMMHAVLSALPPLSENEGPPGETDAARSELWSPDQAEFSKSHEDLPKGTGGIPEKEEDPWEKGTVRPGGVGDTHENSTCSLDGETLQEKSPASPSIPIPSGEAIVDETLSPSAYQMLDSWTGDASQVSSPPVVISPAELDSRSSTEQENTYVRDEFKGKVLDLKESEVALGSMNTHSPEKTPSSTSRSRSPSWSLPGGFTREPTASSFPLSTLLRHASSLLAAYPPSLPDLRLAETFGPESALRTYRPSATVGFFTLDDEIAESCVGGENVVLPLSQEEQDEEFGPPRKPEATDRVSGGRRRRPIRFAKGVIMHRQTVMAGVVLFLGVAVAIYGFGPGVRSTIRNGHGRFGITERWRIAAWVGGILGIRERLGFEL